GQHLGQMLLIEKSVGKVDNFIDMFVADISPGKGELNASRAVGVVTGIGAITDHKQLNKAKQALSGPIGFTRIALGLVKGFGDFHAAFFQLDLNQWQTIDQQGHIKAASTAVIITVVDGDLISHLIDVFTWIIGQEKDVFACTIIKFDREQITQILGSFKYRSGIQKADDLLPLGCR